MRRHVSFDLFAGPFLLLLFIVALQGCARRGSVEEKYSKDFYEIPSLLPDNKIDKNPRFVVYGDNRPGWRAKEVLGKKETWLTWKQLYLPIVYQAYLLGSGVAGGVNYMIWNPDYGNREARMVRDAIYARGKIDSFDFVVNTGDMATDGRRPNDWKRFIEQNKEDVPLVTEYPFLPVAGNHDRTMDSTYGLPNYESVFSYPLYYTFEGPDVEFFVLDSNYLIDQYDFFDDDEQDRLFAKWYVSADSKNPSWLQRELAESQKPFKIVFLHHPPIAFTKHHDNWSNPKNGRELPKKRRAFLDLLRREGVQLVFTGHQHNYERSTVRFVDDGDNNSPIVMVITGGGGSPLHASADSTTIKQYEENYAADGLDVSMDIQEMIYNYCIVDVTPDRIKITAIEVLKSDDAPARVVDEFEVKRR